MSDRKSVKCRKCDFDVIYYPSDIKREELNERSGTTVWKYVVCRVCQTETVLETLYG